MTRNGYVARIREKIGPDLLMLHAVSVFVFDAEGRFLMAQQTDHDNWVTIGGAVEPGETPADAVVREFWEEAGALVRPTRVLGVFGGPDFEFAYPNGDLVAYTSIGFEAELMSGALKPDGAELRALQWIAPSDVAALPMMPGMRSVVDLSLAGRKNGTSFAPATWTPPR